ncbi:Male sterility NAD-binding [Penicillium angulare]|uniref:Male sterility NAD-binding n=1 Tax=Penicillium angulare TaxID=116970 RepID=UPI00254001E3|nr:Male sterility NAD-binding [Penicillium angulare]KAJ5278834.1 Male sterility NAD-binding [Penicillium angulare]
MLPPHLAKALYESKCMTIMDGELGDTATMNLSDEELQMLKKTVHIIIHAAASIELKNSLRELSYTIIAPTLCLTQYAMKFVNLERFVFVSTAYANAHLWQTTKSTDVAVDEKVYPLSNETEGEAYAGALEIWKNVQKTGTSDEYNAHNFPWPYAYAKHLAERLVLEKAAQKNSLDKVLIIRPSVVGPADKFPMPGFTTSYSTPSTACAAAYAIHPGRKIVLSTRCENPDKDATIDEVPVDVVADRLLAHVALGSSGCVHAVSGERGRLRLEDWWNAFKNERRLPWNIHPVWTSEDWHSKNLHHIARNFKIIGTSFAFADGRTDAVAEQLDSEAREGLHLYADRSKPYHHSLIHRRHHIHNAARQIARKSRLPVCSVGLFCRKGKHPATLQLSEKAA